MAVRTAFHRFLRGLATAPTMNVNPSPVPVTVTATPVVNVDPTPVNVNTMSIEELEGRAVEASVELLDLEDLDQKSLRALARVRIVSKQSLAKRLASEESRDKLARDLYDSGILKISLPEIRNRVNSWHSQIAAETSSRSKRERAKETS